MDERNRGSGDENLQNILIVENLEELFTDIYEYVKKIQIRPSSDLLDSHAEVVANFTIRESVVRNLRTERADRCRVQSRGRQSGIFCKWIPNPNARCQIF